MKHLFSLNRLPVFMACVLFVLNRAAAKLSVGPGYFLDILILISLYKKIKSIVRIAKILYCGPILLFIGFSWLGYEFITGDFGALNIRRFALAVYMIVPIIIVIYGRDIVAMLMKNLYLLFVVILIAYVVDLPNFQPTISGQVMSVMLIATLFHHQALYVRKSIPGLLFVAMVYFIVILGLKGDGLYKTPLLGFVLSLVAIILFSYFNLLAGKRTMNASFNIFVLTGIVLASFSIAAVPLVQTILAEAIYALSGLTGIQGFSDFAASIANEQARGRGSSSDTADTRVMFWLAIIEHSKTSLNCFLFGNGHSLSFFDKIFVGESFFESHLLEPHNSFVGIYYRYGFIGLLLFFGFMFQARRYLAKIYVPDRNILIACTIIAINYAMFEVVLESPHGSIIFWIIWLFPYLAGSPKKITKTLPEHDL